MNILAIESSCDESALAIFDPERGLVGEWVHSQIDLHQEYGGVVPDLASREHLHRFGPMLTVASSQVKLSDLAEIVVTQGPGLAGCLAMGLAVGKALAMAWGVPLRGVNHLRGHAFSPFITLHAEDPSRFDEQFKRRLPHLGLLVSGGNTLLFCIERDRSIRIIAQTVDDAAGEALDKGAKLLGLQYPGGPLVEKAALSGDAQRFDFPKAMTGAQDMRFSFSGLKTSLRYRLEKMDDTTLAQDFNDLCASYQEAVIWQLLNKTKHAMKHESFASLGLSGGVANNQRLRQTFTRFAHGRGLPLLIAQPQHTGDNAGMIAFAAWADPAGTVESINYDLSFQPGLALSSSGA